ncbi:hypothetical protein HOY82DRAFT_595093 [Tuber indicum]|nr:hypothetical protein HOY82DRAFT_595093 [Tuber indicum]
MPQFNYIGHCSAEGCTIFHSSNWGGGGFGSYGNGGYSTEPKPSILPGISDPLGCLQLPSQLASHDLGGGIENSDSSHTGLSSINANLTQDDSPSNYPYRMQSPSPTPTIGYAINRTGIHFDLTPSYPQYPTTQEQQKLASLFQSPEFHPNCNAGNPTPSPLPPHYQPNILGSELGNFKRQTDLNRHLKTARKHGAPQGPVCPEPGCKYTARFTRIDNFRAHFRRLHGKRCDEVDGFIQEWRGLGSP